MEISNEWETVSIDSNLGISVYRMRAVGGWLVHVRDTTLNISSTLMIPDPRWEQWDLPS